MPRVSVGAENQSSERLRWPFTTPGNTLIGTEEQKKETKERFGKFREITLETVHPIGSLALPPGSDIVYQEAQRVNSEHL